MTVRRNPKMQPHSAKPSTRANNRENVGSRRTAGSRERDWLDWASFWVGVAGVLAVVAYTTVSYWQMNVTKQALIFGNRAYLFQTAFNISPKSSSNSNPGWGLFVLWQNSGNTAALNVHSSVNVKFFEAPLSEDFGFPDLSSEVPIPTTVGPKGQMMSGAVLVAEKEVVGLREGGKYGYVWGWATYIDQLDRKTIHTTKFCQQIRQIEEIHLPNNSVQVQMLAQPCAFHNCVDEDCKSVVKI